MKPPINESQAQFIIDSMNRVTKLKEADNKKILRLAMETEAWKNSSIFDLTGDIFAEIECRLYPEYDGDLVTRQDWGWKTPEGDIRYL